MTLLRTVALSFVVANLMAAFGCSSPESDPRVTESVPDRASFPDVADRLNHSCGTLDCHGTVARNLRLYGHEGLRLAGRPSSQANTTTAEYDESYLSVIGLEPEVMGAVVRDKGAHPERLTLIRKARGTEHHKGGTIMNEGDSLDLCVTSWLSGAVDTAACADAQANDF